MADHRHSGPTPYRCGHWAWGARLVERPEPGWVCTHCGKDPNARIKKPENMVGRHIYMFGPPRCTPCARAWHDAHCEEALRASA